MEHPSQDIDPSPHSQHREQTDMICLDEEQLASSLFKYYVQLRSDALPSLSATLPEQFAKIQREVLSVVQLRKSMQKSLQIDAIQSQHFTTIATLLEQKLKTEQQIDQLATTVKTLQSNHLKTLLSMQQQQKITNSQTENQILTKSHQLTNQLIDFGQSVCLLTPNSDNSHSLELQSKANADETYIEQIFKEQREKWNHTKLIYGIKFNALALREELADERETAFRDYERSNSELIEVLLREKERDKNLRKKDKEKFQEMLKMRHQIDIQNEELSHSQRTLNSHYEVELLRVKDQLNQRTERHREELQQLNEKVERLQKQLTERRLGKEEQQSMEDQQLKLRGEVSESHRENTLLKQQKKQLQVDLAAQTSKYQQLSHEWQSVQRQKAELKLTVDKLQNKNQELLTQFNEAVLKNSQHSQTKTQLNQKLEGNARTIQQLDATIDQSKKQLTLLKSQQQKAELQISTLINKIQQQQVELTHSAAELAKNNKYISQYEHKLAQLENQLTDNFIAHNQITKALQQELSDKSQIIALLTQQLHDCSRPILPTEPIPSPLEPLVLQTLKQEVIAEMQRSDHIKNRMIDEMVQRLGQMIV